MDVSLRSVLTAGVTAVAATAIVAAPSVAPPPVPAYSTAPVALTAVATPSPGFVSAIEDNVAAAALAVEPQNAASDWLGSAYYGIQQWVDWGVSYAQEIAYWLGGWGVPFAWLIGDQIGIFYYSLIRPIADNIFEQLVVPVVNNPLNLVVWIDGIANAIGYSINDVINFGLQELDFFLGWILPPLPPPPPFWPFNAAASAATVSAFDAAPATTAGPIGNGVIGASQALADVSNAIWDVWNPIRDEIGYGVDVTTDALDYWAGWVPFVPAASFEIDAVWNLIAGEGNAFTGFAHDMINAGNTWVEQSFNQDIVAATNNAFRTTVDSVGNRGGEAIDAGVDFALDNLDYFTGIYVPHAAAAPSRQQGTDEVALTQMATDAFGSAEANLPEVPSLTTLAKDTEPITVDAPRKLLRDLQKVQAALTEGVDKTVDDIGKGAALDPKNLSKAVADTPENLAKGLAKAAKKATKGLEKAAQAVRKAVTGEKPAADKSKPVAEKTQ